MADYIFRKEVFAGIVIDTIGLGKNMHLCHAAIKKGTVLPVHSHEHEQASIIVSGQITFVVNGEKKICPAGTGLVFPPNVPHGGTVDEDTVVCDVFVPLRQDYLK